MGSLIKCLVGEILEGFVGQCQNPRYMTFFKKNDLF